MYLVNIYYNFIIDLSSFQGLNSNSLAAADLLTKVEDKDYVKYLLTVISNEKLVLIFIFSFYE